MARQYNLWKRSAFFLLAVLLASFVPNASFGQLGFDEGGLGGLLGDSNESQVTVSAQFTPAADGKPAVLMVTAEIAPNWHIYPLKMAGGIGLPTKVKIDDSAEYRVIGEFASIPEPQKHQKVVAGKADVVFEHSGKVTFYAPIELAPDVDPAAVAIRGTMSVLVCKDDGQCIPKELPFEAKLGKGVPIGPLALESPPAPPAQASTDAPPLNGPESTGTFRAKDSEVTWNGWLEPSQVTPGATATLSLKAEPNDGWHIYARGDQIPKLGNKPTLIVITDPAGLDVDEPQTSAEIESKDHSDIGFGIARFHQGTVTWNITIRVPDDARLGKRTLSGILGYQTCEDDDGSCEPPKGVRFQVPIEIVATNDAASTQPIIFAMANYSDAAQALGETKPAPAVPPDPAGDVIVAAGPRYDLNKVQVEHEQGSLLFYLGLAFLGGLILNLMPCVLPVIGLKVMSFVEQAGHNRKKALTLNLWYAAGIIAVFLVLAGVAAMSSTFSWGQQSSSTTFNVILVSIVFAMALSLLGVWEIPIPGFIGSGSVHQAAAKEGITGAFLKGIVTTILAIPCTGPFMATALGWAVGRPAVTTFQVFAAMGFGMASPYILVGVYPQLLRFLPKPGAWMETFKQAMGFVLLATVVFILSYMESAAIVPTVTLLVGIALACWIYARTPATAEFNDRVQTWALSGVVVAASALFAFGYLYSQVMVPRDVQRVGMQAAARADQRLRQLTDKLQDATDAAGIAAAIRNFEVASAAEEQGAWQPFSLQKLGEVAIEEGRTVLVDFSAEWCLTCKTLEQTVLHTEPVDQAIRAGNVVTMYADYTNIPPELQQTIKALRSNGVPVIAVFPGNDPYRPIVFRGAYTQSAIIEALEKATGRKLDAAVAMQASGERMIRP